ncbi:PREDICTED: phosphomannomutase-like [Nelumbo nucifera]|uniref:Phosphomannomutase n=2 Tax=Nelumbo nucifera TaxID=4432 RepID=A0A1U8Q8U7_NELNU|nr:PREDICTED: phosphomannomutase-like [Nelumbo nucifera]XP_019055209.1 PREDICTED: phosphomannomutase-like [Nelumbo nucifera]DAD47455.1 TPA_asm: hypothetical protein HUJ06_017392 [Nelumbo nucifera]
MAIRKPGVIALFDVDGTLTAPRKVATPNMLEFTQKLREVVTVGVVGGSDLAKISEQLGRTVIMIMIMSSLKMALSHTQSLKSFLGEEKLKEFIDFTLHYIADLDIPIKRGTFIEFRSGMLNVSPIGRNCSQEERDEFEKYDKVFPNGWDKTYCLRYLDDFLEIHFFGDKTYKVGNDYEIYESERTVGHKVTSPEDTEEQLYSSLPCYAQSKLLNLWQRQFHVFNFMSL